MWMGCINQLDPSARQLLDTGPTNLCLEGPPTRSWQCDVPLEGHTELPMLSLQLSARLLDVTVDGEGKTSSWGGDHGESCSEWVSPWGFHSWPRLQHSPPAVPGAFIARPEVVNGKKTGNPTKSKVYLEALNQWGNQLWNSHFYFYLISIHGSQNLVPGSGSERCPWRKSCRKASWCRQVIWRKGKTHLEWPKHLHIEPVPSQWSKS